MPKTTPSAGSGGPAAHTVTVAAGESWLAVSATPALASDGAVPSDVADQAAVAWANLERALDTAGFARADLVSVTEYVTDANDVPACELARAGVLNGARPACTSLVVTALGDPAHKVRIEAWAAKAIQPHDVVSSDEWEREARRTTDLGYRDSDEADAYERHQRER